MNDSVDSLDLVSPADAVLPKADADLAVGLWELAVTFSYIGCTTFGGMWAASQKLETILVNEKGWLNEEQQQTLMVAATLIPAPKFLAFGSLVGFRLRGWLGSIVTALALVAPGSVMVLAGAVLLNPDTIGAALVPLSRAVQIGVIGVLLGNAFHQLKSGKVKGRNKVIGIVLALAVAGSSMAGVPLLAAAGAGFLIGAFTLRNEQKERKDGSKEAGK
ncbi:MAG TPA: chromate transporter [Herbaspirillum sp.]|jgi:chromate transporter